MDDRRISIDELRQQQRDNWPQMYAASRPVLLRLFRLEACLAREVHDLIQHLDLLPGEFDVLATLRRQPPPHRVTPTELCRALFLSSGGLTKMLRRLEDTGLVSRPANPEDRRSLLVQLTDRGRERVESALVPLQQLHQLQLDVLTEAEESALNQLLEKMLGAAADRIRR